MQLASAGDLERVRGVGLLHLHGDVGLHLFKESGAEVAGGDEFALAPREGRVVDVEGHGEGGLVDLDEGQGLRMLRVAQGLADVQPLDAGDRHNVADAGFLGLGAPEARELIQPRDLHALLLAVLLAQHGLRAHFDAPALDLADAYAPDVIVVVEGGEQKLQRAVLVALRRRDIV